jgi:hypothetical protein
LSTRTARGRQAMLPLVRNSVIQYATNNSSSLWLSLIKIRTDGLSDHETNEIIAFWQWYITNDGLINYLALMIYLFINSIYDDLYVMCVEQTPIYFLNLSTWVISSLSTPKYLFIPIIHGIYVFFSKIYWEGRTTTTSKWRSSHRVAESGHHVTGGEGRHHKALREAAMAPSPI